MMATIRKYGRYIAALFLVNLLFSLFNPTMAWALTAGPTSPEFSSFEPVTTTDMVNVFSGDMVYNLPVIQIPGPDGAGYALSLSYHSGASSESESSWVGHGWTLNPGAINRSANGYPDDYKEADIEVYNKTRPNWTIINNTSLSFEVWSQNIGVGLSSNSRFNNYMGFSNTMGMGITAKGLANLNLGISYNGVDPALSVSINPLSILTRAVKKHYDKKTNVAAEDYINSGIDDMEQKLDALDNAEDKSYKAAQLRKYTSSYGVNAFASVNQPLSNKPYKGLSLTFGGSFMPSGVPMSGPQIGIEGSFNIQVNDYLLDEQKANGYLHTPAYSSDANLEDFAMEKQNQYNKRTRFIGVPYSTADNFMLTGEGLGGGFRAFRNDVGHFLANTSTSESKSYTAGVELQAGSTVGVGVNLGGGKSTFNVLQSWYNGDWIENAENNDYRFKNSRDFKMRFTNDLAGSVDYENTNTSAESATLNKRDNRPVLRGNINVDTDELQKVSSYIETNTEAEYSGNAFNKITENTDLIYTGHGNSESIREISITKEDGSNYVYGIPVYTRNQVDVSIGKTDITMENVRNNVLMKQQIDSETDELTKNHTTVVGTKKTVPYANTYLLTQITGSNFYDRNNDGPDDNDYGAWTKFNYRKKYGNLPGGVDNWYTYRTPYAGFNYSANSLASREDDMGFVSRGEKETYYLKSVETKTHVAFFITNKTQASDFPGYNQVASEYLNGTGAGNANNERLDGYSAADNASGNFDDKGLKAIEKLERIVLFSKNNLDKRPIKVVHFDYNYSLVKNTPNNSNSKWPLQPAENDYNNSGKLTLKKVWFEYEGVTNAKISPYEFHYEYFTDYSNEILNKYPQLEEYNNLSLQAQNPDYEAGLLDPWGNIQYDAVERKKEFKNWNYQGQYQEEYDPAAWQLKRIVLPSGGEIHVQYEQKDYQYVQNRKVMSLVSLASANIPVGGSGVSTVYQLNLADIGLKPEAYSDYSEYEADVDKVVTWLEGIREKSGSDGNMLYFKFLYALKPNTTASLTSGKSDYITGYTSIKSVTRNSPAAGEPITIELTLGKNESDKDHPYNHAEAHILTNNKSVRPLISAIFEDFSNDIDNEYLSKSDVNSPLVWSTIKGFLFSMGATGLFGAMGSIQAIAQGISPGKIDPSLSYFKIINPRVKKGGGIRVKRLLMYDNGFNGLSGTESVYGNEYFYELEDGKSSGVATNEPVGMREENALVGYLSRGEQSAFNRLFFGRDRSVEEGPIGENVLPSPSVGHSRVVVENIHKGKTGTGHVVYEYHTAKDYHFDKEYTNVNSDITGPGFDATNLIKDDEFLLIPAGIFSYTKRHSYATQGFRFVITNMHGQQKRISSFGGQYGSDLTYQTGFEEFDYYEPGESIPMIEFDNSSGSGRYRIENSNPGKEMEIAMNMNSIRDFNWDLGFEVDLAALVVCPLLGVGISANISDNVVNTHSMSKVISYPVILRKKTSMQDNITSTMENKYFDKYTGKAVVTKTYDEYNGLDLEGNTNHNGEYYSTDIKASWIYPGMGPKWEHHDNSNELNQSVGSVVNYQTDPIKNGTVTADGWYNIFTFNKVVAAGLQTFRQPPADKFVIEDNNIPDHWLPWSSYALKADAVSASSENIYNKGWAIANESNPNDYSLSINLFGQAQPNAFVWPVDNINEPVQPYPWLKSTTIELYSPAGMPLMEKNAMGIYSSAKYGYNNQLPILVAQNAKYNSVQFYDFEEDADYPSGWTFAQGYSNYHSGNQSLSASSLSLDGLNIDLTDADSKKLSVKFWIKADATAAATVSNGTSTVEAIKVASSDEWTLFDATIDASSVVSNINIDIQNGGSNVLIDDVRIQPLDSEMKCFVYDKSTFRLLAEFDNQHFGLYYQYNDEGKLVRKIIETERGKYTVQEKQYNLKTKNR